MRSPTLEDLTWGVPTIRGLNEITTTVSPADAATRIGVTPGTLANMRWSGRGPRFIKVGSRVRYRLADIAQYLDAQTRTSTSDRGPDA